jgi:hypothetical protein
MEVGVQSFGAHLGDFFHLPVGDIVEQSPQIGASVQRLQLLLVQVQHFVHSPLVFELQQIKRTHTLEPTLPITKIKYWVVEKCRCQKRFPRNGPRSGIIHWTDLDTPLLRLQLPVQSYWNFSPVASDSSITLQEKN